MKAKTMSVLDVMIALNHAGIKMDVKAHGVDVTILGIPADSALYLARLTGLYNFTHDGDRLVYSGLNWHMIYDTKTRILTIKDTMPLEPVQSTADILDSIAVSTLDSQIAQQWEWYQLRKSLGETGIDYYSAWKDLLKASCRAARPEVEDRYTGYLLHIDADTIELSDVGESITCTGHDESGYVYEVEYYIVDGKVKDWEMPERIDGA